MERIIIVDTETTSTHPDRRIIEVSAALYSIPHRSVIALISSLLPASNNPAEHINGIPEPLVQTPLWGNEWPGQFRWMWSCADVAMAHYAEFDKPNIECLGLQLKPLHWICSANDCTWPKQHRAGQNLVALAIAHGIGVGAAHRAYHDVLLLAELMSRVDNLEAILEDALVPRQLYRAILPKEDRQLAKDAGFRWNQMVPYAWSRYLKPSEVESLCFPVAVVEAVEAVC